MTIKRHLTPPKLKNRMGILALFCLDFATLFTLFHASVFIRQFAFPLIFKNLPEYRYDLVHYWWIFAAWLAIMRYEGGYSRRLAMWDEVKFIWKSSFFATLAILTMLFLMKRGQEYSRILIGTMFLLSAVFFPLIRLRVKRALYAMGLMRRKVLIVGSGEAALTAYDAITGEPNLGYEISGFVDDAPSRREVRGLRVRPGIAKIGSYIKSASIHDVVVAKPELDKETLTRLINHIQHRAENTLYIPDMTGIAVSGTELRHFFREQAMMIEIKNNLSRPATYLAKRVIDYSAAAVVAALISVPMLLIALCIKLSSPGPATYRQQRVGRNGRRFWCYKFRTMYPDASSRLKEILSSDPEARKEWERTYKLKSDPRITPIGDFLRRTSLDELPQLVNILRGEMSLVGPRPVVQEEIDKYYREDAVFYFRMPPGLTGLWQVSGRSNTTYGYRVSLDSWYVKNWDTWLDVMIILKTVGVVLNREGAR